MATDYELAKAAAINAVNAASEMTKSKHRNAAKAARLSSQVWDAFGRCECFGDMGDTAKEAEARQEAERLADKVFELEEEA